jgi:beta-N-acetylhexosaminidase
MASTTTAPRLPPTATTTTAVPARSPAQLAGARVLCSFAGAQVPDDVLARLRDGTTAGIVVFTRNAPDQETAVANATAVREAAALAPEPAPPMIAADQEGGDIRRIPGPPESSGAQLGQQDPTAVRATASATAAALRAWGINTDFAPVADAARGDSFIARQERSFGADPRRTADAVVAFVAGLHDGGVAATLKHFPGLGAAAVNTDVAPSVVDLRADELRSVDLPPFTAGIVAGADLVMVSSAVYPALDAQPAALSRPIVHDLLRGELGFDGVVISDAFDIGAAAALGPLDTTVIAAALAGVDVFITAAPAACGQIHDALTAAIADGRLPYDDATAAYDRVMRLRRRLAG